MDGVITVVEAKRAFSDLMARVAYSGERLVVERHGKPMIAWISYADLLRFEQLERRDAGQRERQIAALAQAQISRSRIAEERRHVELPDSSDVLNRLREERVDDLADMR